MIKETHDLTDEKLNTLTDTHYSRRIKSHFLAYGSDYNFCKFYSIIGDEKKEKGIITLFNSSFVVSLFAGFTLDENDITELSVIINMTKPFTVELEYTYAKELYKIIKDDYKSFDRTEFEFVCKDNLNSKGLNESPNLDDVFAILKTSFPAVANSYDLWITDTSHRIRHNVEKCFTLDNCSSATIQYIIDNIAFIGHVATIPSERGKHHARDLLYFIGDKLKAKGFSVRLYARDYNVSYYKEIGFKPVRDDIVLERKQIDD